MDRYAHRLHDWLESANPGFEVRLAASIGDLTRDVGGGDGRRRSGGYPRWWAQDVDPLKFVLPGPLREPQRYMARYFLYPWWLRREAKRAQLVHILDHTYAHMVTRDSWSRQTTRSPWRGRCAASPPPTRAAPSPMRAGRGRCSG